MSMFAMFYLPEQHDIGDYCREPYMQYVYNTTFSQSQTGLNCRNKPTKWEFKYSIIDILLYQQTNMLDLWQSVLLVEETEVIEENKGNNKITELRAILQRESQNS